MRTPIPWDIYADRTIDLYETIPVVGVDWTGATFTCMVRQLPDAAGSPLLTPTVTNLYSGSNTIANHIAAGRLTRKIKSQINDATGVAYTDTDTVALSVIQVRVPAASMIAPSVPAAAQAGDNVVLAWDLLVQPSGGAKDKWIAGKFIVRGTVTQ